MVILYCFILHERKWKKIYLNFYQKIILLISNYRHNRFENHIDNLVFYYVLKSQKEELKE